MSTRLKLDFGFQAKDLTIHYPEGSVERLIANICLQAQGTIEELGHGFTMKMPSTDLADLDQEQKLSPDLQPKLPHLP